MRVTCEQCATEHDLEPPDWVATSNRAFRFRCSSCGHSQVVPAPEETASVEEQGGSSIYLKQDGKVYLVQGWETLKQWITESRIGPEDLISEGGVRWEHVNSRPEVAELFAEVADAGDASDQDLPFASDAVVDSKPAAASEVFGGVPTGLPPLPVLHAVDAGAVSEATAAPDDSGERTIDDSYDDFEPQGHDVEFSEPADSPPADEDPLGEPGLTEDLVMESAGDSILFTRDEPEPEPEAEDEPAPSDEAAPVLAPGGNTLDDDELFKEFDAKRTAEPAPYAGEEWAEDESRSAAPWVIAALVTLVAIAVVVFLLLPRPDATDVSAPDLSTALTSPDSVQPDVGVDSESDSEGNPSDADTMALTETDSTPDVEDEGTGATAGTEADSDSDAAVQAEPEPAAEPPAQPEPVVAVTPPAAPVPSPQPVAAPAPSRPSVAARIDAGWSKADGGDLGAAGAEFLAALRQRPGSADANLGYGYVLAEQGRAGEAKGYLCAARDSGAGSTAAEARGILTRLELTCD